MRRARTDRQNPQAGISLIETLVALFVVALMTSAGAVLTQQSLRGARAAEQRGAATSELAGALNILSDDLAAFTGRASQGAEMTEPPARFEGYAPRHDGRVFVFVRNGWENPAGALRSDLQRVEYIYRSGTLVRRSWSAPDPGPVTPMAEQVLLTGIESLEAQFGTGDTWRREWVALAGQNVPLPQKAELKIRFSQEDILTLRLPVGAPT